MAVFTRTSAGTNEIATRGLKLSFIERSALLMVDGARSAEEICKRLDKVGPVANAIELLKDLKLIELREPTVGVAAPVPMAVNGADFYVSLFARRAAAEHVLRRNLEGAMGTAATPFSLAIEGAKSPEAFAKALADAEAVIATARGTTAKAKLLDELRTMAA